MADKCVHVFHFDGKMMLRSFAINEENRYNLLSQLMCSHLLVFFNFTLPIFNTPFITTTSHYPLSCQDGRGRGNMRNIVSHVWKVNIKEIHHGDVTNWAYHHPLNVTLRHYFWVPPSPSSADILFDWHLYTIYEYNQFNFENISKPFWCVQII